MEARKKEDSFYRLIVGHAIVLLDGQRGEVDFTLERSSFFDPYRVGPQPSWRGPLVASSNRLLQAPTGWRVGRVEVAFVEEL
jgi:hypothetical protein